MAKIFKTAKSRENLSGYLFILPVMLGACVFVMYPLVFSFLSTFKNWSGLRSVWASPWVGFSIYKTVLSDPAFWSAFKNTLITLIGMPIGLILSMGLALLLNRGIPGTNAFRVIYYVPVVCSLTAIVILWRGLLNIDGPINKILGVFGIKAVNWLGVPGYAMAALIAMCVWKGLGTSTLLYIAGLSGVPSTCIEAAKLDGANNWKIFWKITFPLLMPTHFYMIVTGIINGMQIYLEPRLLTNGGPAGSTTTLVLYLFNRYDNHRISEASVVSWILGIVVFLVTAFQFWINSRREKQ